MNRSNLGIDAPQRMDGRGAVHDRHHHIRYHGSDAVAIQRESSVEDSAIIRSS